MTDPRDEYVDAAGIRLRVRTDGMESPGVPVLLLHGFTGCIETMAEIARAMSAGRPVISVDLVGHGESDAPADLACYTMEACVAQVVAALDHRVGRPVHVLGYSMGGRVGLSLAVAHPERVASLVLVGASPGLLEEAARAERVVADSALARQIEEGGLARFVDYWMGLPLFASQKSLGSRALARMREQRLRCDPRGLALSLRGMGTGAMPPLHDALPGLGVPVCLVAGALDGKFVALAESMRYRLPDARCELVEGVGHAAHLEDPTAFSRIAGSFWAQVEDVPSRR